MRLLQGKLGLVLFWPTIALMGIIIGWAVLFQKLDEQKISAENTALAQVEIIGRNHAGHVKRMLDAIDQILLLIKLQWESSNGPIHLESFKDRGLFPETTPFNASVVDRHGIRFTSTFDEINSASNVSDRPYFWVQKSATTDKLFIGEPTIGRTTGKEVIQFSRRLIDQNGRFDGVVLVSVLKNYFTDDYDAIVLGENGLLGTAGPDGLVKVARSGTRIYSQNSTLFLKPLPFASSNGTVQGESIFMDGQKGFSDKRPRYITWQPVKGYPLAAVAGLDQKEMLAPYWQHRQNSIRTALAATLATLIFTLIATTLSLRLAWRRHQLEVAQTAYRKATEIGSEGFYTVHPIRDATGLIVDFQTIDCNGRCAAFFQRRREEFIGQSLLGLYSEGFQDIRDILIKATETGSCDGELPFPFLESPFGPQRFVHVRAVASEGELGVTLRDITKEKDYITNLERRSNEDILTGLPNRAWATAFLPKAVERAGTSKGMLAVLFVDLDGFKAVNDTLGHAAGDEVLKVAARRLLEAVRPHDHVVRLSGDEFIIILDVVKHTSDASHVAERILNAFKESFRVPQGVAPVGASIGISIYPDDAKDAITLLRNADTAMYAAKIKGKCRYQFFDSAFYDKLQNRLSLESDLRQAILQKQFVMYYQARVDVVTGRTASMEALVRWRHPLRGSISPAEFIALAEESGLILDLGALVIDAVCAQIAKWMKNGEVLVPISINVSSRQFSQENFPQMLAASLAKHGVNGALIELEITEYAMMENTVGVSNTIKLIHDLGIKLSVDDFGTGYSSLSQLQELDFDVLKVDQRFTEKLGQTDQGTVFYSAIITMAHALGMRVVAEGVERKEQLSMLRALHCDEVQGFFISRPLEATNVQAGLCPELPQSAA